MSEYRRRRFLMDLLFVGGAIVAAAGLASTGETPAETPSATPSPAQPTCPPDLPMPGEVMAPPPPQHTPEPVRRTRLPGRDPFGERPGPPVRLGGAVAPPHPKPNPQNHAGGVMRPHPGQ